MKKIIASALILGLLSSPAMAWGDREQGILTGIAGLWVFQQLDKAGKPQNDPVIVQQPPVVIHQHQAPVIVQQPVQYCDKNEVWDRFGKKRIVTYCYYQ
jgi:hypothetical protein